MYKRNCKRRKEGSRSRRCSKNEKFIITYFLMNWINKKISIDIRAKNLDVCVSKQAYQASSGRQTRRVVEGG